ncbi:zinc-dependent metalloprotease [Georgenia deserti]|uniref:Zinc-dependent metalloprotease n=1 Tax=Georgenia deserti TaxID=2093781 RepID=A0ABW4KYF0_9MICO
MSSSVDWQAAVRRAGSLAPPGPAGTPAELRALVQVLRRAAREAPEHVGEITGLTAAAEQVREVPVFVVDRPRWSQANVEMFSRLTDGLLPATVVPGSSRMAAEEMGVVLAVLSTKVLGQFDPFTDDRGRLLLVAPNVRKIERELNLDAMDFRLWVCLHEQTHAVQFAAAPWLAEHLGERMRRLVGRVSDTTDGAARLGRALRGIVEAVSSAVAGTPASERPDELGGPLVDAFLDEEERAELAEIVAVMSLLEGHADVVMDEVGPARLPSVRHIRAAFDKRRDGTSTGDVVLRRVLGMDAKVAQYRNGAGFVRAVVAQVGHDGLNAVWTSPEALPTAAEVADPAAWVRRIHG